MLTSETYHDNNSQDDELMSCPERWEAQGGMQPLFLGQDDEHMARLKVSGLSSKNNTNITIQI